MNRSDWIGVITCVAALFLWWTYNARQAQEKDAQAREAAARAEVVATTGSVENTEKEGLATGNAEGANVSVTTTVDSGVSVAASPVTPSPTVIASRTENIHSGDTAKFTFSNDAGGIERVTLLMHFGEQEEMIFLNGNQDMPIGALGFAPEEVITGFEMSIEDGVAVFTKTESDGLQIIKRFHPPVAAQEDDDEPHNPFLSTFTIEFRNTGAGVVRRVDYFVSLGRAAPIHFRDWPMHTKFAWAPGGKMSAFDTNWFNAGWFNWRPARSRFEGRSPDVAWAAVSSQYFATILTPQEIKGSAAWASRFSVEREGGEVQGIQGALGMPGFTLAPGEVRTQQFELYTGPKELELLSTFTEGQDKVMNFGFFGFISKTLLWGMNSLYGVFGSYAVAIIVLTIIIKLLLWPVQNKATREMRKMSLLGPKMTEMRAKYKDTPQKLNEETMKMYKEYGVNPFSGCLPMLIQIPIFFGFYSMLGSAIQLRNSRFLWVADLSQPDTIGHIFNFPINLLPIVMAGTMIWQMVISPKSGDVNQQRIFYFMPVIFLVFCYNFASGLALYWTTQNIFSIVQLYLTRNRPLPQLEKKSVVAKREAVAQKVAQKKQKKRKP